MFSKEMNILRTCLRYPQGGIFLKHFLNGGNDIKNASPKGAKGWIILRTFPPRGELFQEHFPQAGGYFKNISPRGGGYF